MKTAIIISMPHRAKEVRIMKKYIKPEVILTISETEKNLCDLATPSNVVWDDTIIEEY